MDDKTSLKPYVFYYAIVFAIFLGLAQLLEILVGINLSIVASMMAVFLIAEKFVKEQDRMPTQDELLKLSEYSVLVKLMFALCFVVALGWRNLPSFFSLLMDRLMGNLGVIVILLIIVSFFFDLMLYYFMSKSVFKRL